MASMPEILVEVRAIGHCKDCRWWGYEDDDEDDDGTRRCSLAMMVGGEAVYPESKAIAWDGVDDPVAGVASLWTKPDFGCVQWEAKESE